MPIGKGQQFAGAGKGDGLEQADLAGLSHLGSDGQYPNNMFRDFKRHVHREVHDMPRPYNAQLPMLKTTAKRSCVDTTCSCHMRSLVGWPSGQNYS